MLSSEQEISEILDLLLFCSEFSLSYGFIEQFDFFSDAFQVVFNSSNHRSFPSVEDFSLEHKELLRKKFHGQLIAREIWVQQDYETIKSRFHREALKNKSPQYGAFNRPHEAPSMKFLYAVAVYTTESNYQEALNLMVSSENSLSERKIPAFSELDDGACGYYLVGSLYEKLGFYLEAGLCFKLALEHCPIMWSALVKLLKIDAILFLIPQKVTESPKVRIADYLRETEFLRKHSSFVICHDEGTFYERFRESFCHLWQDDEEGKKRDVFLDVSNEELLMEKVAMLHRLIGSCGAIMRDFYRANYDGAIQLIQMRDSHNGFHLDMRARCMYELDNVDEAISLFRKIEFCNSNYVDHYDLAAMAIYQTNNSDVLCEFLRSPALNHSEDIQVMCSQGMQMLLTDQPENALLRVEEALKKDPTSSMSHHLKGIYFCVIRSFEKALGCLFVALKFNPLFYQSFVKISQIFGIQGNYPAAYFYLLQALNLQPNKIKFWDKLNQLLLKMGREQLAKDFAFLAISLHPEDMRYEFFYAKNLARFGNFKAAISILMHILLRNIPSEATLEDITKLKEASCLAFLNPTASHLFINQLNEGASGKWAKLPMKQVFQVSGFIQGRCGGLLSSCKRAEKAMKRSITLCSSLDFGRI